MNPLASTTSNLQIALEIMEGEMILAGRESAVYTKLSSLANKICDLILDLEGA